MKDKKECDDFLVFLVEWFRKRAETAQVEYEMVLKAMAEKEG
jgi:hypothetical protein